MVTPDMYRHSFQLTQSLAQGTHRQACHPAQLVRDHRRPRHRKNRKTLQAEILGLFFTINQSLRPLPGTLVAFELTTSATGRWSWRWMLPAALEEQPANLRNQPQKSSNKIIRYIECGLQRHGKSRVTRVQVALDP